MKNTKINYLYRDASNYKVSNMAIINGLLSQEDIQEIVSCLYDGDWFIPSLVGLPENRFEKWTVDDHPWFELTDYGFEPTDEPATVTITSAELLDNFRKLKDHWDEEGVNISLRENISTVYNAVYALIATLTGIPDADEDQQNILRAAKALIEALDNRGEHSEPVSLEQRRAALANKLLPQVIEFINEFDYNDDEDDTAMEDIAAEATNLYEILSRFVED